MDEKLRRGILWNRAAAAGVALGAVSSAYLFITQYLSGLGTSIWISGLNLVLWGVKLLLCVWLMMHFMKRLTADYEDADNAATFRFGMITALCSALIFSAVTLANVLVINPDLIHQQIEAALKIYGSSLDSNSLNALDTVESIMPQVMFFSNLVYCFLYGTVLSAILSRNIPPQDPFARRYGGPDAGQGMAGQDQGSIN